MLPAYKFKSFTLKRLRNAQHVNLYQNVTISAWQGQKNLLVGKFTAPCQALEDSALRSVSCLHPNLIMPLLLGEVLQV